LEKFKIGQLKDEQWDIVHSVVKERRDTILNAATGFGKSLTFQILPFVHRANEQPGIVLIIMPLKLLQSDQAENINKVPGGSSCVI
jgi:superfamily II DNA helicase RecQ